MSTPSSREDPRQPAWSSRADRSRRPRASWIVTVVAVLVLVVAVAAVAPGGGRPLAEEPTGTPATPSEAATTAAQAPPTPTETASPSPAPTPDDRKAPSHRTALVLEDNLALKSVVANDDGVVFAQNMMYRHTISVFDATGALVETIPDSVTLSEYGVKGHPGTSRGAPVETAFRPDGQTAWVSNYSMYGNNFGAAGSDICDPDDGTDPSYLYRIDVETGTIEDLVEVGAVPKYVAVTPDGAQVLVANWCTWDLSIVDSDTTEEVARVPLDGAYPRGIAMSPDGSTAYVALMGSDRIVTVDLQSHEVATLAQPGDGPVTWCARQTVSTSTSPTTATAPWSSSTVPQASTADRSPAASSRGRWRSLPTAGDLRRQLRLGDPVQDPYRRHDRPAGGQHPIQADRDHLRAHAAAGLGGHLRRGDRGLRRHPAHRRVTSRIAGAAASGRGRSSTLHTIRPPPSSRRAATASPATTAAEPSSRTATPSSARPSRCPEVVRAGRVMAAGRARSG